jgi:hypothetical protein
MANTNHHKSWSCTAIQEQHIGFASALSGCNRGYVGANDVLLIQETAWQLLSIV